MTREEARLAAWKITCINSRLHSTKTPTYRGRLQEGFVIFEGKDLRYDKETTNTAV